MCHAIAALGRDCTAAVISGTFFTLVTASDFYEKRFFNSSAKLLHRDLQGRTVRDVPNYATQSIRAANEAVM